MKKLFLILIFLFCILFNICDTKADYDCSYKYGDYEFTFTFDTENYRISSKGEIKGCSIMLGGRCSASEFDLFLIESSETLEETKDTLLKQRKINMFSGFCDTTVLVIKSWHNSTQTTNLEVLFNDTLEAEAREYIEPLSGAGQYKDVEIDWAEFDEDNSTGKPDDIGWDCDLYKLYFKKIEESSKSIKNCNQANNCTIKYGEYEKNKQLLRDYCRIQYKYLDVKTSCVNACLNSSDEINKLGVENLNSVYMCGFSEKLIQWIANIVKWLKYIVPVIVIVLGILDFIKAIASEKDDEMKKAQGRFTKRLIAAALIFIIPFIIEFILVKMGFAANACGIIDL